MPQTVHFPWIRIKIRWHKDNAIKCTFNLIQIINIIPILIIEIFYETFIDETTLSY